jgi:hypothetical protein
MGRLELAAENPRRDVAKLMGERMTQLLLRIGDFGSEVDRSDMSRGPSRLDPVGKQGQLSPLRRKRAKKNQGAHLFQLALPAVFLSLLFHLISMPEGSPTPVASPGPSMHFPPFQLLRKTARSSSTMSLRGRDSRWASVRVVEDIVLRERGVEGGNLVGRLDVEVGVTAGAGVRRGFGGPRGGGKRMVGEPVVD